MEVEMGWPLLHKFKKSTSVSEDVIFYPELCRKKRPDYATLNKPPPPIIIMRKVMMVMATTAVGKSRARGNWKDIQYEGGGKGEEGREGGDL